jgi:hypothetical protein
MSLGAPVLAAPRGESQAARTFASPEAAVDALVAATRADRPNELAQILGRDGHKLVFSGDPVADRAGRANFIANYDQGHSIDRTDDNHAVLVVGAEQWPMPIPLVRDGNFWRFDATAGEQEVLARRIGRNELSAIQVCGAYVDAQREYAWTAGSNGGLQEYAQHFVSSPGKHDGLFWETQSGQEQSPLGPLVASARAEGYRAKGGDHGQGGHTPYHGYYYRILLRQGPHAPGGAYDYIADGHMIGGFALVAFPAKYGDSGIMTFIINQDGVVYQQNLGPRTEEVARSMMSFDPGPGWIKVP